MTDFEVLKKECSECTRCDLCRTRHNVVFGVGNETSRVMFVGEGPGENEDLQGEPFVGKAGQLLDVMLELIGLDRNTVYICNIVKCRPPQNRDPAPSEREACRDWLRSQIDYVQPKIIVCLGRIAACELIDPNFKITKDHGQWYDIGGVRMLATYHPSALLRDESKRPDAFSDFRKIRAAIKNLQ